ncbi:hypothetical protein B0T22DRAFT_490490 [Podospora appendiculata]|uniref:NmrA-like domain-containing protein n=1 Tax=Podospora appendiculata TaxID=314037 RepID=A0AAE1CCQ8_9PEZI|nr:hypothetical protein B0T22DRAFT_490490 [Podospora appendiculata]
MSKKIVTVVGATGTQGKGVIAAFRNNPSYHIRALTRSPTSASALALSALGLEVVQADINDPSSLQAAFAGSHIIYAVTNFFEPFAALQSGPKALEVEVQQGINLADAAAATPTLEHYIWSTLPNASAISAGKYLIPHFEGKNRVDDYIKTKLPALWQKTTRFWVSYYSSNLAYPMFTPYLVPTAGKYVQFANYAPGTLIRTVGDVGANVGPFVKAVVEQPDKTTRGAAVLAALPETYTAEELLQTWARARGVKAQLVQISRAAFGELWPLWADEMGVMMEFWEEFGERSWSVAGGGEGEGVLDAEALGLQGLQGLEEAFRGLEV